MNAFSKRLLAAAIPLAVAAGMAALGPPAMAQQSKPNIIVIMGDDIGWSNIGVYNQGIMAGRTPNLDQLADRRHAVHRLLCRGQLHGGPRQLHHRRAADPHRHDHGRPGGLADRHPRRGDHDRDGAQVAGLCHRPVRQEPSGRPERVPADRPRLRRVLRLPLSPGRDGGPLAPQLPAGAEGHRSGRATWSTAGPPTPTIRPSSRAGARSASRGSRTPARSIRSG